MSTMGYIELPNVNGSGPPRFERSSMLVPNAVTLTVADVDKEKSRPRSTCGDYGRSNSRGVRRS